MGRLVDGWMDGWIGTYGIFTSICSRREALSRRRGKGGVEVRTDLPSSLEIFPCAPENYCALPIPKSNTTFHQLLNLFKNTPPPLNIRKCFSVLAIFELCQSEDIFG